MTVREAVCNPVLGFLADPNCKLEDKPEDGEALDGQKRPEDAEELEDEAVHSCDSCLQVFESLSDITEHKINQCQLAGTPPPLACSTLPSAGPACSSLPSALTSLRPMNAAASADRLGRNGERPEHSKLRVPVLRV